MTCPRAGKLFGACRFSARYDVGPPTVSYRASMIDDASDVARVFKASKTQTYVCDVCERCGQVSNRPASAQ